MSTAAKSVNPARISALRSDRYSAWWRGDRARSFRPAAADPVPVETEDLFPFTFTALANAF
jgi:hypothetical protein